MERIQIRILRLVNPILSLKHALENFTANVPETHNFLKCQNLYNLLCFIYIIKTKIYSYFGGFLYI